MSSLKNQIKATSDPAAYTVLVSQALKSNIDPHAVEPEWFGYVTSRIFERPCATSARHLTSMRGIVGSPRVGASLIEPFYRAVKKGLSDVKPIDGNMLAQWPEFFAGLLNDLRADKRLRDIVAQEVVARELPAMIWSIDPKRKPHENKAARTCATSLIKMLDGVGLEGTLDQAASRSLVRAYLPSADKHLAAGPDLMELRTSPTLRKAVVELEDDIGVHVAVYDRTVKGRPYGGGITLALRFDQAANTVTPFELQHDHRGCTVLPIQLGNGLDLALADALVEHACADLPGQEWVAALAEAQAYKLGG